MSSNNSKRDIIHSLTSSINAYRGHLSNVESALTNCDLLIATEFSENLVKFFSTICSSAQTDPLIILVLGESTCHRSSLLSDICFQQFGEKLEQLLSERFVRFVHSSGIHLNIFNVKNTDNVTKVEEVKIFEKSFGSYGDLVKCVASHCKRNDVNKETVFQIALPSPLLDCGIHIISCPEFPLDTSMPEWISRMIGHFCPNFTIYLYRASTEPYSVQDCAILETVYLLMKRRCRIRADFHQFVLIGDKTAQLTAPGTDHLLHSSASTSDEEVKKRAFRTTTFDAKRLLPVIELTEKFFKSDRNKIGFFDHLCRKIDTLAYDIPGCFADHCKFPKSDILWKAAPQQWHSIWFDLKSLSLPPELLDAGLNCSNCLIDFGCGYTVFASEYEGKSVQITRLCRPLASLIDYEEEKVNVYYESSSSVCLYDAGDTLFIIDKETKNLRLMDCLHQLSFIKIQRFIETIALDLFCEDKTLRLETFRPDNIYIDLDKDEAYYNLRVPSSNTCLPLILADNRMVDPFHLYISDGQNENDLKEKQAVYSFGWLVWILVEGSGRHCPDINATQERWVEQAGDNRSQSVPQYLIELMTICWNVNSESWRGEWTRMLKLIREGFYEAMFKPPNSDIDAYVNQLIEDKDSINLRDEEGVAPLHRLAYLGLAESIQKLVDHGGNVNVYNKKGSSPLHIACYDGHIEAARTLIDNGVDINLKNKFGATAIMFVAFRNHADLLRLLIHHGAILDADEESGFNALHYACSEGHVEIVKILLENGMPTDNLTKFKTSALHLATDKNHPALVKLLLDHGAFIDVKNKSGWTPLHTACSKGHTEVISVLIDKGAALDMPNVKGFVPLYLACDSGHLETVRLMIERGASVNSLGKDGYTLLHISSELGHNHLCELLIDHGCPVDALTDIGDTALLRAAYDGHSEVVKVLISRGANVDYKNAYGGWTALHIACFNGHINVALALIQADASLHIENDTGLKPLDCCGNHPHIGQLLVDTLRDQLSS